jgi:hypothetical protein
MNFLRKLFAQRCSVCGTTSEALMKEFRKRKPGVDIIDTSWVGVCPECGEPYCINHSTKTPDPYYGDEVPACPVHKKLLKFP